MANSKLSPVTPGGQSTERGTKSYLHRWNAVTISADTAIDRNLPVERPAHPSSLFMYVSLTRLSSRYDCMPEATPGRPTSTTTALDYLRSDTLIFRLLALFACFFPTALCEHLHRVIGAYNLFPKPVSENSASGNLNNLKHLPTAQGLERNSARATTMGREWHKMEDRSSCCVDRPER